MVISADRYMNSAFFCFFVSGPFATTTAIASNDVPCLKLLRQIYVDQHGDENIGIQRQALMIRDDSQINEQIGLYLTGEWVTKLM